MNYVVRKKVDKSGDKEVVRYYAASKVLQPEPVSNDELAKRLAFVSSLQVGDAQSVLAHFAYLLQGGRQFHAARLPSSGLVQLSGSRIEEGAEEEVNGIFSFFLETARTP